MSCVETIFTKYRNIVGTNPAPNEAPSRCSFNLVIFHSVLEERMTIHDAQAQKVCRPTPNPISPTTPIPTTAELSNHPLLKTTSLDSEMCLFFETELKQTVTFKGKPHVLSGLADYSLGYRNDDTGSGNLIVVEAKRKDDMRKVYGQLLCYMGMIHQARKAESKNSAVIFGVATDGFEYRFWRVDHQSNVSSSPVYIWHMNTQRKHIYTIFRAIVRAAILSSPVTSPSKRTDVVERFQTPCHSKFDFGAVAEWEEMFKPEGDSEVELVEISSRLPFY